MATQEKPGRASNLASATAMGAPYATEAALHSMATLGAGATVAGVAGVGTAAVYAVAKHREDPRRKARRDLRTAARTASGTSKRRSSGSSRSGKLLGGKSGVGRVAGSGKRSSAATGAKRTGASSAPKRAGAAGGLGRSSSSRKSGTALAAKPAGASRAQGARSSRSPIGGSKGSGRGSGRGSSRAPFGHGPRGSAARTRFGASSGAGGRKGGAGGSRRGGGVLSRLTPGGKSTAGSAGRKGGLFAGSAGRRKPSSDGNRRRNAGKSAAARSRASLPLKHNRQRWRSSAAGHTVARSWKPFGRKLGKQRRAGVLPAIVRGVSLAGRGGVGVLGSVAGVLMFTPHLLRANHALGVAAARNVNIARSALAGWLNPYTEQHQRRLERELNTSRRSSGGPGNTEGHTMSNVSADHVEALIDHVRDASVIDREQVTGVGAAAHAEAMGRLVYAVAEYAGHNVEILKEALPQMDGGESLSQQANVLASAAQALEEAAAQFEGAHEDRLQRQRDPEPNEAAWDVSAVQN